MHIISSTNPSEKHKQFSRPSAHDGTWERGCGKDFKYIISVRAWGNAVYRILALCVCKIVFAVQSPSKGIWVFRPCRRAAAGLLLSRTADVVDFRRLGVGSRTFSPVELHARRSFAKAAAFSSLESKTSFIPGRGSGYALQSRSRFQGFSFMLRVKHTLMILV